MGINEIEKAAMKLSSKERAKLSYRLLESIDSEVSEDIDELWQKEVEERYMQITQKSSSTRNAESVINEAKSKYK